MEEGGSSGGGGNAMVKSELEAAEALAGLACQEIGEPSRRQSETESLLQHDSVSDHTAALHLSSELAEDKKIGAQCQSENISTINMNMVNVDPDAGLHRPRITGTRSQTYISDSKSRRKMTEEEKEARRIRRVLANRESARQTIRRRQAMYDELISKAASLAQENESLSREMDLAIQRYDSLKITNESFKKQMVKAVSSKQEENRLDLKPTITEMPKSSCTNCPFNVYNQSQHFPFIWPAFVQPPNAVQTQSGVNLFPEHAKSGNENIPNPPFYILPCPFFYPVSDHGAGIPFRPSSNSENHQIVTPISYSYTASSSTKTVSYGFEEVQAETSGLKTPHEVPFKLQADPSVLVNSIASVKPITSQRSELISGDQVFALTSVSTLDSVKGKKLDLNVCPSKNQADAMAAAEARKRRKELTKLKNLHCRDFGSS